MKKFLRILAIAFFSILALVAFVGMLFGYFIYSPPATVPKLSGTLSKKYVELDGLKRSYLTYVPKDLPKGAPLVVVLHGSGQTGADIRGETGYGFERLADAQGFSVVYPSAYTFDWNDCSKIGDYEVNGSAVDDIGFLVTVVNQMIEGGSVDEKRVFVTGVSAGGSMSIRLAMEAPSVFSAVAAVSASVPAAEHFKCSPGGSTPPVMIMNGTKDPLVPFEGGEINLLGYFFKAGNVRSAGQSAQYFAELNGLSDPETVWSASTDIDEGIERVRWRDKLGTRVELVSVRGGGHGMPQPYWRRPRLLGPSPMKPNGPELIWSFFKQQMR
jgi:polyhydroxybutyrate depolymerase